FRLKLRAPLIQAHGVLYFQPLTSPGYRNWAKSRMLSDKLRALSSSQFRIVERIIDNCIGLAQE
ncbi:MAG: hypothetical protein IJ769_06995, partial [Clostridia bacterium]|nr:hypothetical protein [Clostridia bacterium]